MYIRRPLWGVHRRVRLCCGPSIWFPTMGPRHSKFRGGAVQFPRTAFFALQNLTSIFAASKIKFW